MTPKAAEEMLSLIMLDDFVARRAALDTWTRRWVATFEVSHVADMEGVRMLDRHFPGKAKLAAKSALAAKTVEALVDDECRAVEFDTYDEGDTIRHHTLKLRVLLTEPREA